MFACLSCLPVQFAFHITLLQQLVHSRLMGIFTHHGACDLAPPLLSVKGPLFSDVDYVAQFMDRNGIIVVLPTDHRVSHYILLFTGTIFCDFGQILRVLIFFCDFGFICLLPFRVSGTKLPEKEA